MDAGLLIVILVVLVLLALLALVAGRQRRSRKLQDKFGPEYERTVAETGDRRAAETELRERTQRRDRLDIVPLEPDARERYVVAWRSTQALFVDEPSEACREADRLITSVMRDRGYPVDNFEQRATDVSVDHPQVVDDYRAAQAIAAANARSEASTEDLRQALVHYRSLFEELLDDRPGGQRGDQVGRETTEPGRDETARSDAEPHRTDPDRSTEEAR
jgi:hypothetical protein